MEKEKRLISANIEEYNLEELIALREKLILLQNTIFSKIRDVNKRITTEAKDY